MGWGATIWLILMTGVIGGTLAHRQGFATIQKIQSDMAQGRMPAGALLDGLLILVAGLVLITPGIITDCIGFSLLIPPVRQLISRRATGLISKKFTPPVGGVRPQRENLNDDDVIDV